MSGRPWAARDVRELRRRYPHECTADIARDLGRSILATYNRALGMGLHKSSVYLASHAACRLRHGSELGKEHRFREGMPPHNKGKHFAPAGSEKGWFRPGTLNGAAKDKTLPIGSERVQDGVLLRKVCTSANRWVRWVPVHRNVWEIANGAVPLGCIVVFRRGQHTTDAKQITLDRLECITRAENMRRNSRHTNYPPEVNQLMQLRGALKRKIGNRERKQA